MIKEIKTLLFRFSAATLITSFLLFAWGLTGALFAQDIHFSQFQQTPLIVNPALTGAFSGDQRAILNYKSQWTSFGAPYKTFAFSFDSGLLKKKWKKSYLGAGLSAYNDQAGDTKLGTMQVIAGLSAILTLNNNQNISAGISAGYVQRSMKGDSFEWGNQFAKGVYDPGQSSGEAATAFAPFGYADVSGGLNWNYGKDAADIASNDELKISAGLAAFHLNRPDQKFLTLKQEKLHIKLIGHVGAYIGIENTNISLLPSLIYFRQGSAQEINAGMMIRYTITEESRFTGFIKECAVSIGGHYRLGDAVIPQIMVEYANYAIGISYDVNVSALKTVTNTRGGIEIALRYINPNPFRGRAAKSNVKFL